MYNGFENSMDVIFGYVFPNFVDKGILKMFKIINNVEFL